ncbi:endolytic transglycosylase MltG, partial [Candidatus Azambacteria bacterium]|nr:endolytic transglycosylase MltG [Candidatus Azambacteria bacterium]
YDSSDYGFLIDKPKELDYEGYLFPDTYRIFKDESLKYLIEKIFNNLDSKLTVDLRNEIRSQGKTIFEIITMASIIEKEVKTPDDKKIVAGILWKRLSVNMPLQVDASLGYITGKTSRQLTKNDLSLTSPYNTYTYRGLPRGPISNPSLESIMAATYPQESEFWYYLSTKNGQTIFSKNFEDHKKAKQKYLR